MRAAAGTFATSPVFSVIDVVIRHGNPPQLGRTRRERIAGEIGAGGGRLLEADVEEVVRVQDDHGRVEERLHAQVRDRAGEAVEPRLVRRQRVEDAS